MLSWSVVIPVKELGRAKSRLTGLPGPRRAELALAVAADTVAAALRARHTAGVVVVTDDPVARAELAGLGARVVADEPRAGLNPALTHGARLAALARPAAGVAALSADLPALRPEELERALAAAALAPAAFVADAAGTGTTLYTARPGVEFAPRFGDGSRARHAAAGARELVLAGISGLRRDVDTPDDLREAAAIGLGPRTAALVGRPVADPPLG